MLMHAATSKKRRRLVASYDVQQYTLERLARQLGGAILLVGEA